MAFNPFDAFRKNSKPMMAALTIFVMIVFVLSTGGGGSDFFEWMARQVGGSDSRGTVMGAIGDTEYHSRTLHEIRHKRAAANAYMSAAVAAVDRQLLKQVKDDLEGNKIKDAQAREPLEVALYYMENLQQVQLIGQIARQDPQTAFNFLRQDLTKQNRANLLEPVAQLVDMDLPSALDHLRSGLETYLSRNRENEKGAEFRAARRMSKVLSDDLRRMRTGEDGMFFLTIPNKTDQDALEFELYRRLADKMGIKFVDDDITKLVDDETENMLHDAALAAKIDQEVRLQSFRGISGPQLRQAIGDEFRVETARKLYNGAPYSDRMSTPVALTPFEFYEFYKDRCAEATFEVVDVPVEAFLPQVQIPTSEVFEKGELDSFFRKYSKQEYEPSREEPGFKEPRKVKLEYVVIDAAKPVYKGALPVLQAVSAFSGGYSAAYVGVGVIPGVMEAAAPLLAEPLLVMEDRRLIEKGVEAPKAFSQVFAPFYPLKPPACELLKQVVDQGKAPLFGVLAMQAMAETAEKLLPARTLQIQMPLRDSSAYNPFSFASLTGYLAVGSNPWASPCLAVVSSRDLAELFETRDRAAFGLQMTLAPLSPLFQMSIPVASLAPALVNLPPQPTGVYLSQKAADRLKTQVEAIAKKDFEALENKMTELHKNLEVDEKKPDDGKKTGPRKLDANKVNLATLEARNYLDNWIRGHPWVETGKSATLRDKYQLGDDPALKDVFAQFKDSLMKQSKGPPDFERFIAEAFFDPRDANQEVALEANKFRPVSLESDFSKPVYAVWKVDDRPAKEHPRLDQLPPDLREQVVKAWKMQKARVLAQTAAENFAESVRELANKELRDANNVDAFRSGLADKVRAANFSQLVDSIRIAKLKKQDLVHAPRPGQLTPYVGPFISNKQLKFPVVSTRANPEGGMAEQLIELRNKPLGESLVLPNRPRDHFYVAILTNKEELSVPEFYRKIYSTTNVSPQLMRMQDSLYNHARFEAAREYRKDLAERLKAEMKYTETEEMKKSLEKPREPID